MVSVSVALATYNGEKFLLRQLQSLSWQNRLPDELVVCDDCSTDSTLSIIQEFAVTSPFPVRIFENERTLNFRRNFMKAANHCTSEIILFCDQDDVWRPEKIDILARTFEEQDDLLLAYHAATIVDSEENTLRPMFDTAAELQICAGTIPPPWHYARGLVQAFRRELLQFDDLWSDTIEHFENEHLAHDRWYFLLAFAFGKIRFLSEDLLMYRQHGSNLYGADRELTLVERVYRRLQHSPDSDLARAAGARSRAKALEAVRRRILPQTNARLNELSEAYTIYADRLERRLKTYTKPYLPSRAMSLICSVARSDYHGNPWGFDPLSVFRDAWMGVLRGGLR